MKSNTLYHNPIGWLGNNLMFFLLFDRSLEFIPKYIWVIPLQTAEPEIQEQMCELNFDWCHSLTHITLGYLHYFCINPILLCQLFLLYLCILFLFTCKVVWYGWIIIFLYLKPVYMFFICRPSDGNFLY